MTFWDVENELEKHIEMCQKVLEVFKFVRHMSNLPTCNDCKRKECRYKPKWGDTVRYNCPLWTDADDGRDVILRARNTKSR